MNHLKKSNYTWINTFTQKPVSLWNYYETYDQPLIKEVIRIMRKGLTVNLDSDQIRKYRSDL